MNMLFNKDDDSIGFDSFDKDNSHEDDILRKNLVLYNHFEQNLEYKLKNYCENLEDIDLKVTTATTSKAIQDLIINIQNLPKEDTAELRKRLLSFREDIINGQFTINFTLKFKSNVSDEAAELIKTDVINIISNLARQYGFQSSTFDRQSLGSYGDGYVDAKGQSSNRKTYIMPHSYAVFITDLNN